MACGRKAAGAVARFLVVAAALVVPACDLTHPLVDPDKAKLDERLFGVWKAQPPEKPESEYWYLFIGPAGDHPRPGGLMKAVEVLTNKVGNPRQQTMYFVRTALGRVDYANVIANAEETKNGSVRWDKAKVSYLLIKYAVEKNRLTIWLMDMKAARKAIAGGRLKGRVHKDWLGIGNVKVTETTAGLSRFLAGGGDKMLFPDSTKFVFRKAN